MIFKQFCKFSNKKRDVVIAPETIVRTSVYPYIICTLDLRRLRSLQMWLGKQVERKLLRYLWI
jgi:hypothetical protein